MVYLHYQRKTIIVAIVNKASKHRFFYDFISPFFSWF